MKAASVVWSGGLLVGDSLFKGCGAEAARAADEGMMGRNGESAAAPWRHEAAARHKRGRRYGRAGDISGWRVFLGH